jgi:hypothetical protein
VLTPPAGRLSETEALGELLAVLSAAPPAGCAAPLVVAVLRLSLSGPVRDGESQPADVPDEVWAETTRRYIDAYERLTGTTFERGTYPVQPRIREHLHV